MNMANNQTEIIILVAGPIALNDIGWKFLLVLIIPTAIYWFLIYFLFPETRQQSLEDINEAFGEKVAVHYHGATEAEEQEYHKAIQQEETRRISLVQEQHVTPGKEVKA